MQMMLVSIGNFMLNISMQSKPLNSNPNNETLNDTCNLLTAGGEI